MYALQRRPRGWRLLFVAIAAIGALWLLAGCGETGETITVPASTPVSTAPVDASPSPTVNDKDAFSTRVALNDAALATSVALTHEPVDTPGPPQDYPSPTPRLGLMEGVASRNAYEPRFINAWAGVVSGEIVQLWAGREGLDGDPTQGVVMVFTDDRGDTEIIRTPQKVGAVRIESVNGMLFTIATVDHQPPVTFVFDLTTRRWVSPSPGPSPSPLQSPLPSPSLPPVPTISPLPSPSP